MSKIVLNDATTPDRLSVFNSNFQKIEDALNNQVLYRDNPSGTPNSMSSPLDMNGQRIYNLPAPTDVNEAARLKDVQDAISGLPTAALIPFTPVSTISSTNVQGAIGEVVSDLSASGGAGLVGINLDSLYPSDTSGWAARVINNKVNVLRYIPVSEWAAIFAGTSTYDCGPAFQTIWDLGQVAYAPKGRFRISTARTVPAFTGIVGDGWNTIIETAENITMFTVSDAMIFKDLQIVKIGTLRQGKAFDWPNCFSSLFDNIWIKDFAVGIEGEKTVWTTFRNVRVDGCTRGIWLNDGGLGGVWNVAWYNNANLFDNCVVDGKGIGTHGVEVWGATNMFTTLTVQDLTTEGVTFRGVSSIETARGNHISNLYAEFCTQTSIRLVNAPNTYIGNGFVQGGPGGSPYPRVSDLTNSDLILGELGLTVFDNFTNLHRLDATSRVYNNRNNTNLTNVITTGGRAFRSPSEMQGEARSGISLTAGSPGPWVASGIPLADATAYRVELYGIRDGFDPNAASFILYRFNSSTGSCDKLGGSNNLEARFNAGALELRLVFAGGGPWGGTVVVQPINTQAAIT